MIGPFKLPTSVYIHKHYSADVLFKRYNLPDRSGTSKNYLLLTHLHYHILPQQRMWCERRHDNQESDQTLYDLDGEVSGELPRRQRWPGHGDHIVSLQHGHLPILQSAGAYHKRRA